MSTVKEKELTPSANGASPVSPKGGDSLTHPNDTTSGVSCQVKIQQKILEKLREIAEIVKEYNPDADELYMNFSLKSNTCTAFNEFWDKDMDKPLNLDTYNFLEVPA